MYWNSRLSTCFLSVCTTSLLGIHHKYVNLLSDLLALHQTIELQALVHSLARFFVPTMPLFFLCIAILALVSALVRTHASSTLSASTSASLSIFRTIPSTSVLSFLFLFPIGLTALFRGFPLCHSVHSKGSTWTCLSSLALLRSFFIPGFLSVDLLRIHQQTN